MKTQILIRNSKPTSSHLVQTNEDGEVTGIQQIYVQQGGVYATMSHLADTTTAISTVRKTIPEVLALTDWTVIPDLDGYEEVKAALDANET